MFADPADTPLTTPLAFTVATASLSLLHEPPAVPLLVSGVDEPIHTEEEPLIKPALTFGFTVSILNALTPPTV